MPLKDHYDSLEECLEDNKAILAPFWKRVGLILSKARAEHKQHGATEAAPARP